MAQDYRLYILMRNDLQSMVPGRCMAQASHATSAMEREWGLGSKYNRPDIKEWRSQTPQGFGTTIVLGASEDQIERLFAHKDIKRWMVKGWVTDPDYTVRVTHEIADFIRFVKRKDIRFIPESADEKTIAFTRKEKTCAYIFGTKEELAPYIGDWPLF